MWDADGFTLLEVLLAISIFAMVGGVLFSSFSVGLDAWRRGSRANERYHAVRTVADVLQREIGSAFPYELTPGTLDRHKKFYCCYGESDSLLFVSYANLHRRTGGLSLLELWLDRERGLMLGEAPALVSSRSELEDLDLRDPERSIVLHSGVRRLALRYLERATGDEEGSWIERWDPEDRGQELPAAVEVELELTFGGDDDGDDVESQRLVIPVMAEYL